ncbi:MAG TPA: hypothetical protein VLE97_11025 [Gaiellaceae bacterium]|nr:hypothetical protein [Gaiellaceae bacterium]
MNRKQLEQCAWDKTPKDERRSEIERYDWATKKTITKRLKGNEREVRVFDPSGHTPGTMSPFVPLWSLYSDELEQRCKEEIEPKLRAPYNRMRADYTGDVESSPGTRSTAEGRGGRGGSTHHATRHSTKKDPFEDPIQFQHNGFTYRTNRDASVVEGHDGRKWNRTHSLGVRDAALRAIELRDVGERLGARGGTYKPPWLVDESKKRGHATKKSPAQLDREIEEALGRFPFDEPELQAKWRVGPSDLRVGQRFDYFGKPYEITKIGRDKARTIQIARRYRDPFGKEELIDHRSFPMRAFYQQHLRPMR